MGREFELKYRAVPEAIAAIQAKFGGFQCISMETTYYDTPGRALGNRHWTFRRRLENGISVCTLKIPHKDGGRGEWETEEGEILSAAPALCKLGAPAELETLVSTGVEAVCGARFIRLAKTLHLPDATVELALDRGVLLGGDQEMSLCEVEVELKTGRDEAAISFAGLLAEEFGLIPEKKSKFRRALDLASEK